VVEAEPVGDAQHLPADLVRGEGGDESGGVAGGAEPPFDPAQPVGPAGQALVDDKVGQRRGGGVQGGAQRCRAGAGPGQRGPALRAGIRTPG